MHPMLNPITLSKITRSYFFDLNRIWNISEKQIQRHQSKCLKKMVKYAYTVPLYQDKYDDYGVHPDDIKSIKDIEKLPFISKEDLRKYYPKGILPKGENPNKYLQMSTSGSTGKPVFVYCDIYSAIIRLILFLRQLKIIDSNWRKSKIAHILDLDPSSVESTVFQQSAFPILRKFLSMNNIRYFNICEKPELLIQEINNFQPEIISSYPGMLRELAFLKNKGGWGKINPKYLTSGGSMLDNSTRQYIENAFNAKILDIYGCTEAGPIAFQCHKEPIYHINSDVIYLEAIDKNKKIVKEGKRGYIAVTQLYGSGTPIIRYTGLEDIIILNHKKCKCGIENIHLSKIEGRSTDVIILPNKKIIPPLAITGIPGQVMAKYGVYSVKQFQIIQHDYNKIEIFVIIDESLIKKEFSKDLLLRELKDAFHNIIGKNVNIRINEVADIQKNQRIDNIKLVVSKIKRKDF